MSQELKEQRLGELAFVGVDTHKDEHTASIANCFGESLAVFTSENRPKELALQALCRAVCVALVYPRVHDL